MTNKQPGYLQVKSCKWSERCAKIYREWQQVDDAFCRLIWFTVKMILKYQSRTRTNERAKGE